MIRPRALRLSPLALLLLLIPSTGFAQSGINLSWNDCGPSGFASRTFACNTNVGSSTMVLSVITGQDIPELVGAGSVIYLQTNQASLSNWWQLGAGGCRATDPPSLTASFDFTNQFNCLDPWGGAAFGSVHYEPGNWLPNSAKLTSLGYAGNPGPINGTDQYYLHKVTISYARTTGAGSCAGCPDGVCIFVSYARLISPAGLPDLLISGPIERDYVRFQSGGGLGGECPPFHPPPVSTRSSTWGAVKSLYR